MPPTAPQSRPRLKRPLALGALLSLLIPLTSRALTIIWADTGTTFSTGANWGGSTAPINTTTNDLATFGTVASFQPTLTAARSVAGLAFTSTGPVTLSGAFTLSLGASGINNTSGSGTKTISANLSLAAAQTFSNDGSLTVSGPIANGANLLTLAGGGTGTAGTLSGIVSGTGALTKAGNSTWTLTGANTFTGATTVSAGVLNLQHATATGTTAGGVTVASGAALELQNNITVGAEALSLSGTGVSLNGALRNISGDNTWGGAVTLAAAAQIQSDAGTLTLTGAITGANFALTVDGAGHSTSSGIIGLGTGSLTKTGTGTLTLTGANTYTGATAVSEGVLNLRHATATGTTAGGVTVSSGAALELQNSITVGIETLSLSGTGVSTNGALRNISGPNTWGGALTLAAAAEIQSDAGTLTLSGAIGGAFPLTFDGAGNTTVSGAIGTAAGTLTKSGSGILTLTSATNSYTGTTTVTAGTLQLSGANGATTGATAYTLTGGTLVLDNTTAAGGNKNTRIADTSTLALSGGNFSYKGADAGATNSTETIGAVSGTGGSTVTVAFGGTNLATLTAASLTRSTGNGSLLINGTNLGQDTASSASVGRLIVTAAPTLTGNTAALATGINTGVFDTSIVPFLVGEATATTGGLGTATGTANTLLTYHATTGLRPLNPTDEFTANAITAATNTRITSLTSVAASAAINSLVISGGDVSIDDAQTLTNTSGALLFTSTNTILPTSTSGALTFTAEGLVTVNAGLTGTITAAITGSSALTKSGAGTLTLSGANTYTGTTTVAAGTLALGANDRLANTSNLVVNGGTFDLATFTDTVGTVTLNSGSITGSAGVLTGSSYAVSAGTISAILAGTGALTKSATGTVTLSGTNTYTGITTVSAGTLASAVIGNGGVAGPLGNASNAAANLVLNGGTFQYTGATQSTARLFTLGTAAGSTLDASGSGALTFSNAGSVALAGTNTARTFTLTGSNTDANTLTSILANNGSGATSLTKTGNGTWVLAANNTYTGATTINGGTLQLSGSGRLADTSAVTINATTANTTALLELNGVSDTLASLAFGGAGATATSINNVTTGAGTLTLAGSVTFPATNNPLGSTLSGNLSLGAATRTFNITDSTSTLADLTVSAVVSGTINSGLTKTGTGTLVLPGANTFDGITLIQGGTLSLTSLGNVSGANSSLGLPTTLAKGTIGIGTAGTAATLLYTGNGHTTDRVINLAGTTGGATLDSSGSGPLVFTSAFTATGAGLKTLTLTGSNTTENRISGAIVNSSSATAVTKSGAGTWVLSANNTFTGATTVSAGTLRAITSTGALGAGALSLGGGTLNLADDTGLAFNRNTTLTASSTLLLDRLTTGADTAFTLGTLALGAQTLTLTAGGNVTGTAGVTFGATTLSAAAAVFSPGAGTSLTLGAMSGATFGFTVNGAGNTALTGIIGTTSGTLAKSGTGTLTLSGVNTYTGTTTLNAGTLAANSTSALGDGSATNTLIFNGGTLQAGGTITSPSTRTVTLTSTGLIDTNANSVSVAGIMSGTGGLTKNGTGTLTLSGVNTYTGATSVNAGTLSVNGTAIANTVAVTVLSGATLALTGSETIGALAGIGAVDLDSHTLTVGDATSTTFGGIASGTGALTKAGAGTLTLSGANTYTGATTIGAGTVSPNSSAALGDGSATNTLVFTGGTLLPIGTITSPSTRTVTLTSTALINTNTQNLSLAGVLSGTGGLTKSGTGTLFLSGTNTFTGVTTLSAGTLSLSGITNGGVAGPLGNATNAATNLLLGGGTLQYTGTTASSDRNFTLTAATTTTIEVLANTLTLSGASTAISGALTKTGPGTLTLSGANLHTGATTLTAGTLRASTVVGALGAGTLSLGGGTLELANDSGLNFARNTTLSGATTIRSATLTGIAGVTHTLGTLSLGAQSLTVAPGTTVTADTAYGLTFGLPTFSAAGSVVNVLNNGTGTGTLTFGALAGNVLFTKQGAGTLLLNTASTRTGSSQLDTGIIKLGSTTGLGAAGQTTTLNGATLHLATDTTVSAYPITVLAPSTVLSDRATGGTGITHLLGTLAIAGTTLSVADGTNVTDGTAYGLTFGATTLNGSPAFDIAHNGAGTGTLTLGTLNDTFTARSVSKSGNGTLTLNAAATRLVNGTTVNLSAGTLSLTTAGALGTLADVNLAAGTTLNLGAAQTLGSLDGTGGSVTLGANALTLGSTNHLNSTFGGVISGTGALTKTGSGTVTLSGANTLSGAVTLTRGALTLNGASGALASALSYTLRPNATLTLDNTSANNANRLASVAITSNGGTFNFTHDSAAATNYSETLGALTLSSAGFAANLAQAATGQTSAVTLTSLTRAAGAGTALFSGTGLGADTRNQFLMTTAPTLTNSTVPWAVITTDGGSTYNLITHSGNGTSFAPLASYNTGSESTWVSTSNARPGSDQTLAANRSVSSLVLDSGIDLLTPAADRTITFTASGGAILQTGGTSVIGGGGAFDQILAFGATEGLFHVFGNLTLQRGDATAGITGTLGITKTGSGTLVLQAGSTNSGVTRLNAGTLRAETQASALGAGNLTLNDGILELAGNSGVNFARNTTLAGDVTIKSDTVTASPGVTHTLGTLSIGDQTLSLAPGALVSSGTSGLTFGATTLSAAGAIFDTAATTELTLGALTGNVLFTKQGAGTLLLNTVSARTGSFQLDAGTVKLGAVSGLGAAGQTITLNGGTLDLATDTTVNAHPTTVTASTTILSDKATAASAGITHTLGTLSLNGSTLTVASGTNVSTNSAYGLTFGATTLTGNATVDVAYNGSGLGTLTLGVLAGNFNLTKQGPGQLTLVGTGTRSAGLTTLNAGTLRLANASGLGTAATTLVLNGGTLDLAIDATVNAHPTTVTASTAFLSGRATAGAGVTHAFGTLALNGSTVTLSQGSNVTSGTAGLTFGATALTGNPSFSLGTGTQLNLGALNDNFTARTFTKSGAGTLSLATAATSLVTGTTVNVDAGTLSLGNATALGTLADVNLVTGATLALTAAQTLGALDGTGGSVTLAANPLTLGSTNNLNSAFGGVISGTGALTKAGNGTATLSGTNTLTGAATLNRGTLTLSGTAGALASAASYTLRPNATLTLTNTSAANNLNRLSSVAFTANGGSFSFTHDSAPATNYSETLGAVTLNAGHFTANLSRADTGQTSAVTVTSVTRAAGGTALFSGTGLGADTRNQFLMTTAPALTNNTVAWGVISNDAGTTYDLLTHDGNGTSFAPLTTYNTGANSTWLSTGNVRPSADQTLTDHRSLSSLVLDSGIDLLTPSLDRTLTFTASGGAVVQTAGTSVIGGSGTADQILAFGATEGLFHIYGNLTLQRGDSAFGVTGTAGVTKTGTGTLILQAGSTNTGITRLNAGTLRAETQPTALGAGTLELYAGTLQLASDTATDFARNTTVAGDVVLGSDRLTAGAGVTHTLGTLAINASTLTLTAGDNRTSGTAGLTFGATTLTAAALFDPAANTNLTLGAVSGAFLLTKQGAGTLTLNNPGTQTVGALLHAGTVSLGSITGLGTTAGTITLNGGTLDLATDSSVAAYPVTVTANSTLSSSKATAASAGITHLLGNLSLNPSTLSVTSGANVATNSDYGLAFSTTTLTGNATLDVANNGSGTGTVTLINAVGETGGARTLTKQGAGTLAFSGPNTLTGGVTLTLGTLTVNTGGLLAASTAPLVVNGGTLNLNNSAQTVSSLSGSGGTINFGTGHTLTLNQIGPSTLVSALGGAGNLNFTGGGTATLSGGGGGSGTFTASGGSTYQLGANSGLPSSANLTLTGGNLSLGGYTQTLGTLTLGAGVSTIDFGAGASTLVFAAITGQTWSGALTISNYTAASGESLKFGTDSSSVTGGYLSAISFSGYSPSGATVTGGFVVPAGSAIPEPSTYAALAGALALLIALRRRR